MKDPGQGATVHIEFESEEKANAFRQEFNEGQKDSIHIRWDRYNDRAYSLVWLADE